MFDDFEHIVKQFKLTQMPVEKTYIKETYRSNFTDSESRVFGTAIIGLYSENPLSLSCFHKLCYDEVWHFYEGDPLELYLLYENGTSEKVIMGRNWKKGQVFQYVVPANVWQGGCIAPGGKYSLYGCTMAPGFVGSCFEAGTVEELLEKYPKEEYLIKKLGINGNIKKLPKDYAL